MHEQPKLHTDEETESEAINPEATQESIVIPTDENGKEHEPALRNLAGRISDIFIKAILECHDKNDGSKAIESKKLSSRLLNLVIASNAIVLISLFGIDEKRRTDGIIETHRDKVTEVEVEDDVDGVQSKHKEFKHEDPETTHIINALCGKEHFTEKEQLDIAIGITVKSCIACKIPVPENIQNWTMQEIRNLYIKIANSEYYPDELDTILRGPDYSKELYSVIWEQEKKSGSPYVRWSVTDNTSEIGNAHNRAFYTENTHTMYIKPEALNSLDITHQYVAEVSHALQFTQNPTSSILRSLSDNIAVTIIAMHTTKNSKDIYDEILYSQPGTIEHEAHHVIEPVLQAEIDKVRPKRTNDTYEDPTSYYLEDNSKYGEESNDLGK